MAFLLVQWKLHDLNLLFILSFLPDSIVPLVSPWNSNTDHSSSSIDDVSLYHDSLPMKILMNATFVDIFKQTFESICIAELAGFCTGAASDAP